VIDLENTIIEKMNALAAPALACVGSVAAALAGPIASAADVKLIDFADRLVPPDQVAAAGYAGAVVYVSASPRQCSTNPSSSPRQTPASCWEAFTWMRTTSSPPISANGTLVDDS